MEGIRTRGFKCAAHNAGAVVAHRPPSCKPSPEAQDEKPARWLSGPAPNVQSAQWRSMTLDRASKHAAMGAAEHAAVGAAEPAPMSAAMPASMNPGVAAYEAPFDRAHHGQNI